MSTTVGRAGKPGDTILITGSGTGLGLATALYLAEKGFNVYATVPDIEMQPGIEQAASSRGVQLRTLRLNLLETESIDQAVATIMSESGSIFGLVNNAGIGVGGCLEDFADQEIRDVFDVNVFGTMALTKRVLPHMRAARRGRVITISSVGGRIVLFGLSSYCASKFALEAFGEALALEVAPFGVQSVLIEPGIIKSTHPSPDLGIVARTVTPSEPYAAMILRSQALGEKHQGYVRTQPIDVAKVVHTALTADRPKLRYVVGRLGATAILMRRYLPERYFERIFYGRMMRQVTGKKK